MYCQQCDKLATVDGRTKLTALATVNVRCLIDDHGQFITLIVHVCVQHDAREAARRAGPSATASSIYPVVVGVSK